MKGSNGKSSIVNLMMTGVLSGIGLWFYSVESNPKPPTDPPARQNPWDHLRNASPLAPAAARRAVLLVQTNGLREDQVHSQVTEELGRWRDVALVPASAASSAGTVISLNVSKPAEQMFIASVLVGSPMGTYITSTIPATWEDQHPRDINIIKSLAGSTVAVSSHAVWVDQSLSSLINRIIQSINTEVFEPSRRHE